MKSEPKLKCKFLTCMAGMGLAGMGICFLRGEPDNPNCPKYENEKEWYAENCLRYASGDVNSYGGEV